MTARYLLILLAFLMIGTLGAFFLFVAILPAVIVAVFLLMLCGMFWAGLYLGQNAEIAIVQRYKYQPPEWSFPKRVAHLRREYKTAA